MSSANRGRYIIDQAGPWRRYVLAPPDGWKMIGTIQRGFDIGALGKSPIGIYAQLNAGALRVLDQRKTLAALQS